MSLTAGSFVRLRPGDQMSSAGVIFVEYDSLLEDLQPGDRLILGDGAISLRVLAVGPDDAEALIETGGRTQGRPGVHLPSERMRLATPTADELACGARDLSYNPGTQCGDVQARTFGLAQPGDAPGVSMKAVNTAGARSIHQIFAFQHTP